jgi:hypothetical protein
MSYDKSVQEGNWNTLGGNNSELNGRHHGVWVYPPRSSGITALFDVSKEMWKRVDNKSWFGQMGANASQYSFRDEPWLETSRIGEVRI